MTQRLRVGVASQTPLVRMKRTLDELEADLGPLPDPVPLDRLERSKDYSVTPGGVARMVHSAINDVWSGTGMHGTWVTLDGGFPRDLEIPGFRLTSASVPQETKAAYGTFKEIMWEAINGMAPQEADPLHATGDFERLREGYLSWNRVSAARLQQAHEEDPFDLFYVNDWQQLPAATHLHGAPRILHFHAPFAEWVAPGWREFTLHYLRRYEGAIVSTRAFAETLRAAGFDKPVHQVYPWLDPADYPRASAGDVRAFEERFGVSPDDEIVLHVGRMDPVKAQDRLLRAMPALLRERPRAKLVLVGNGSFSSSKTAGMGLSKGKRWRSHLEALCKELGIEERVVFTGHVSHGEVIPAFERCDAFAFPSVGEGFGLAVAEAWLYEKPVVVSPGAGISEIVDQDRNGLVVDVTDPKALASALARLLALPDGGRAMGEAGRHTALRACDVRVGAWEVLEVFESLLEGRRVDAPPPLLSGSTPGGLARRPLR